MNLDDLTQEVRAISTDPAVQGFADQLAAWKGSSATAEGLAVALDRYIGNALVGSTQDHERLFALWSEFRRDRIAAIHGMTMNERLYSFSLLDQFYSSGDSDRQAMYGKLHASVA